MTIAHMKNMVTQTAQLFIFLTTVREGASMKLLLWFIKPQTTRESRILIYGMLSGWSFLLRDTKNLKVMDF